MAGPEIGERPRPNSNVSGAHLRDPALSLVRQTLPVWPSSIFILYDHFHSALLRRLTCPAMTACWICEVGSMLLADARTMQETKEKQMF